MVPHTKKWRKCFESAHLKSPTQAPTYVVTRSFRNYKADQFATDIAHIPWDTVNLRESVDDRLDAFNDLFLACLENHAPVRTVKIRYKPNPFITEDIRDLMKERDCLHQRARKTGTKEDWKVFRELRNRVKVSLREAEREYYNQEICENKNNCGAIWKTIRSALPNKTGRASFTRHRYSQFFTSVGEKAARDFAELAQSHSLSNLSIPFNLCPSQTSDELFEFKAVTSDDVRKVIMAMPSNKAPG